MIDHLLNKSGIKETALAKLARSLYRRKQTKDLLAAASRSLRLEAPTKVLAINHFFHGELKALAAVAADFPDVAILPLEPEPCFSEIVHLFPPEVRRARIEYDHPSLQPLRGRAREISARIFRDITAFYPFNCVITPSDSFYWLREFILECKTRGIPVIVADKEGTISPASYRTDPPRIRRYYPPLADYFLVWSERQREFWKNSGVAEDRVTITGAARSDIFVNMKRRPPKSVIFFDFDLGAYLDMVDWEKTDWTGKRDWGYLRDGFRKAAASIAIKFPSIDVIVKCHPQQVSEDFESSGLDKLPNVKIISGAEISELMPDAYAVAGFQTTALMEAALAGIPVFYAAWGDLFERIKPEMLPFHESGYGMTHCTCGSQITEEIAEVILGRGKKSGADSSKLEIFFSNHDGKCARRILTELKRITAERRA